MEMRSVLLTFREPIYESPVSEVDSPRKGTVLLSFAVFFVVNPNSRWTYSRVGCRWFELSWRSSNGNIVDYLQKPSHALQWRHNGRDSVSNHQPHDCLLNRLFRRRSKETSKLRVTGLYAGNSPVTREFPAQMASNAENVSIWWRHRVSPPM